MCVDRRAMGKRNTHTTVRVLVVTLRKCGGHAPVFAWSHVCCLAPWLLSSLCTCPGVLVPTAPPTHCLRKHVGPPVALPPILPTPTSSRMCRAPLTDYDA